MKNRYNQTELMTIGKILLLYVVVFTVDKKENDSIDEWLVTKRSSALSCGPVQSASGHNSWPKDDNSGNGCTHQGVAAALLYRGKRDKIHGC